MTADELAAWATDVEQQEHPSATCRDLAKLFKETGAALDEGDPRRDAASYEQLLFDLFLPPEGEFRDQWGPLAPMMTFSDGCYPPPIAHFPDEAVAHYKLREARAQLPTARARLQDFLWLRDGDHKMARRAITSYMDAFREPADGNIHLMERLDGLKRALELARTLRDVPDELADLLVVEAEDTVTTGSLGYVCQLIKAGLNELATQRRRAQALLEKLRDRADRAAAAGGLHRHDERSLLETASLLAKELSEAEQARAFQEQAARSYEYEACERAEQGALIESALLQDAAQAYASVGMSEDLMRVKGLLHDASRRSLDEMKSVSSSVSVPHERLERAVDELVSTGHELGDHGVYYAVALTTGVWPPWSDIQSQTEELKETAPLQYLVRKVRVGPDGQPLPRPTDEGAAQEFDEGETYVRNLQIVLQFVSWSVVALRERNEWTATGLRDAILRSPHFADAELAIEAGTEAFEANRHWDALHVLVPQLERGLRRIAQLLGVDVYTYRSASGRLEWASVNRILTAEPVQNFLNRVRPALALELDLLLSNPAGLNLRNDVAHGVLDPNQDAYAYSLLVVLILLVLATPDLDPATIQTETG